MLTREEATAALLEERLALTALAVTIVRSFHLAEEVFQDLCVKALTSGEEFESRVNLLRWAKVTCRNRAIDIVRAKTGRHDGLSERALDLLLEDWDQGDDAVPTETRDALAYCLEGLTRNNRRILQLRYFEGYSGIDVARILGRKPATVYQALARIHNALEKCIQVRLAIVGGGDES